MAIFLGNKEPQWPTAVKPSTDNMFPHYGMGQTFPRATVLPGFSNDDAAGSAIKVNWAGGYAPRTDRMDYLDKTGTAITTSAWNGGIIPGDCASGADNILGFYMDDADDVMYMVCQDVRAGELDRLQFVSVNKGGTIGTFSAGWQTPSGTSFDGAQDNYRTALRRTGGDGSGNFEMMWTKASPSKDTTTAPYTGCILTFNASTGALTESVLVPDTALMAYNAYTMPMCGWVTSNNIVASIGGNTPDGVIGGAYGTLLNKSTGNGKNMCLFPTNDSGAIKLDHTAYYPTGGYHRGYAWVSAAGYYGGVTFCNFYNTTDLHNMIDEMAVQHGIL
jgi:hypothetical protein